MSGQSPARRRYAAGNIQQRRRLSRRIEGIEREIHRLVDAIAKGYGDPAVLGARVNELTAQGAQRRTELVSLQDPADVALQPSVLARYEQQLEHLQVSLAACVKANDSDGVDALRELVESVIVRRDADRPGVCRSRLPAA